MRVLVLCDDHWHPAPTARAGLAKLSNTGWEFDWIENAGDWSAERMAEFPLVLLSKSNDVSSTDWRPWVTPQVEQTFRDYVRRGKGLLVIHSGTAGYRETPILRALIGGVFVQHPPPCSVTLEFHDGHPLANARASFTITDEHYFMDCDQTQVGLFMTATSEHGTQPAGWTRHEGDGRVCVLTPGHSVSVWLHPAFQTVMRHALQWCGKQV
ncbi:MAG: ThuA domain-containing protein [Chloroflexi bacterium]|nr:ThuA domain-containing protein [Chloroflexota bacterium]